MTRILRLLLIAAIALPIWQPVAAQTSGPYTPPSEGEDWQIQTDFYHRMSSSGSSETGWALGSYGTNKTKVVVSGNYVYIQGLSKNIPEAWVRGTINGTTVEFVTGQIFGTKDGVTYYFVGQDNHDNNGAYNAPRISNVYFDYNPTIQMLTLRSYTAHDEYGEEYRAFYYINEATDYQDLNSGVAYHEGTVLIKIDQNDMATLNATQLAALPGYTYGSGQTGTLLDEVEVTDEASAEHAIALMRAVYTNKAIPGPTYRGYDTSRNPETAYPVSYAAVGRLSRTGSWEGWNYVYTYNLNDSYGWGIPVTDDDGSHIVTSSSNSNYRYCDPNQYKPNVAGNTLLLVEMRDDFEAKDVWTTPGSTNGSWQYDKSNLTQFVLKTIKKVRVLDKAKRAGTNVFQGTLFKIDATNLNRFFFLGKGQARFCISPYITDNNVNIGPYLNGGTYYDGGGQNAEAQDYPIFYHMFEEFSPAQGSSGIAKSDIYYTLQHQLDDVNVTQTGFNVYHDCPMVPYAELDGTTKSGHEFKMLDDNTPSAQAPDVKDLLFFVPDYRMMSHTDTQYPNADGTYTTHSRDNNAIKFYYYNQDYAPRMDMYVIHMLPVKGQPVTQEGVEHVYELEVKWKSNMASFLPATEQEFVLYRCITDANGTSAYEKVYKTSVNGKWVTEDNKEIEVITETDDFGNVTTTYKVEGVVVPDPRVPVVMRGYYSLNQLDYFDYIPMDLTGKQVTYYVTGQDTEEFLGMQESNRESYVIPGYQKNLRMTFRIDTDNYSKFDFEGQKNNYWNEILVANNKGTCVTADFFKVGTKFYFYRLPNRSYGSEDPYHTGDLIATATVTAKDNGEIKVSMKYDGDPETVQYTKEVDGEIQTITETKEYTGQVNFTGSKVGENKDTYTFTYPTTYINAQNQTVSLPEDQAEVNFNDWKFYDNFIADVSQNAHPSMYAYRAYFESAVSFELDELDGDGNHLTSKDVLSNPRIFKVYKTSPTVNPPLTLQSVLDDDYMDAVTVPTESKLKITGERSSKSEIYRYEIFRWADGSTPNFTTPYGYAQNQVDAGYSVKFGENDPYDVQSGGYSTTIEMEDTDLEQNGGAYYYVPQVKVFSSRLLSNGGNDYNTYGAPRVNTAMGKVEVGMPDNATIPMSTYMWYANGNWYSYYNVLLDFQTLNIPNGYELYKVRAWREVDENIHGEEYYGEGSVHDRQVRLGKDGLYLYEDINYGDMLTLPEADGSYYTMNTDNFLGKNQAHYAAKVGDRSVSIAKPQNPDDTSAQEPLFADAGENELRATFGAKRMKTADDPDHGAITELPTKIKVRAYFTRSDNPLITEHENTLPYVLYVLGDGKNVHWWTSQSIANLYSTDGKVYTGNVTITESSDIQGYGKFNFTTKLGASWDEIKNYRLGPNTENFDWGATYPVNESDFGQPLPLVEWKQDTRDFVILPGTYKFVVTLDGNTKNLVITPARANAPHLMMTGDNEQYYVAEGEFSRAFSAENIITGIETLNSSEVVGVKYYNTLGIESSTPFQGVNIVVTRYSDGSITTTKILK